MPRLLTDARTRIQRFLDDHPRPASAPWMIVFRKEFADNLLSVRFFVLLIVLGLVAIIAVSLAASSLRDAAEDASQTTSPFLLLFTQSPKELPSFVTLVGFLGPLVGIAFGFDAVNNERTQGTLARLVSQPVHRDDVINGKFVAGLTVIALTLAAVLAVVTGVGIVRLGVIPGPGDLARLILYLLLTVIYIGAWLGFALLCSVLMRRAATSALVAIAAWLVFSLFGALLAGLAADAIAPAGSDASADEQIAHAQTQDTLSRLSPSTLYGESTAALLNPNLRTTGIVLASQANRAVAGALPLDQSLLVVWPQTLALVAITVVIFAITYVVFLRQEIRA